MLNKPCIDCGRLNRSTRCIGCKRKRNRLRPTPAQRGYDYAWRKLSKEFRQKNPYCFVCGSTVNLTTDHILSLKNGGESVWSNLQTLCRKHNSEKGSK